ncbi:MAG: TadG family pilus assembly protein [Pseudomonas sp.]|uniref:TadG family pilus assembly protein n=1 Tax=Pseudomonas sp. TaxID=306 RepID=UPI003D127A13
MDGYCLARQQRGAIGVMSVMVLGLLVMFLVLVADAGRLFMEQRRLQRVADLSALEASSYGAMCGNGTYTQALQHARAGAQRNGFAGPLDAGGSQVQLGVVQRSADGTRRIFNADPAQPQAVRVQVARTVPASLVLGGLFGEQVTLRAQAVAQRTPLASFSLGSGLLALDSNQSVVLNAILGRMLGTTLNLDAASYKALAGAMVNLLEVSDRLRLAGVNLAAGTVDELLQTNVTAGKVIAATVAALDGRGTLSATVRNGLNPLLATGVGPATVKLGDILKVQSPAAMNREALRTDLSVMDLITSLAFLSNRSQAVNVSLDGTGLLSLLGLGSLSVRLYIVEAPQIAIGLPGRDPQGNWRTQVRTAQLRVQISSVLTVPLVARVNFGLALDVAQGWAALESIDCGSLLSAERDVHIVTQPGIASLSLGTFSGNMGASNPIISPISVDVLGGALLTVAVSAQSQVINAQQQRLSFLDISDADMPTVAVRQGSSAGLGLGNALTSLGQSIKLDIRLLGGGLCGLLPICSTLGALLGIIGGLVGTLGNLILDPLLQLLGLQLGFVDVRLLDVQADTPRLLL